MTVAPLTARLLRRAAAVRAPIPGLCHGLRAAQDVHLTFDDGPFPDTTPAVLDALKRHGARATFFVVGANVEAHPEIARRMVREGHALANHTFSHPHLDRISIPDALAEVARCHSAIAPLGGLAIFRPTYGIMGLRLYRRVVDAGFRVAYWTVDSAWYGDLPAGRAEGILKRDLGGEVLLMHDDSRPDLEALDSLLAGATARGHRFEVLS